MESVSRRHQDKNIRMPALSFWIFTPFFVFGSCQGSGTTASAPRVAQRIVQTTDPSSTTIATRFPAPDGFYRAPAATGSFAAFLRTLPLRADTAAVHLWDGRKKRRAVWAAVVGLDVGDQDLQQCADAVMRLRAEWLNAQNRKREIAFHLTNGFCMDYGHWMDGYRLRSRGNATTWVKSAAAADTRTSFRQYLDVVFAYAGTLSLAKELKPRAAKDLAPGDVFIRGGSPGHAVIVVDVVQNSQGEKRFLIAQSYMPAQEIHVLKNYGSTDRSAWYRIPADGRLDTPEWDFQLSELRTW